VWKERSAGSRKKRKHRRPRPTRERGKSGRNGRKRTEENHTVNVWSINRRTWQLDLVSRAERADVRVHARERQVGRHRTVLVRRADRRHTKGEGDGAPPCIPTNTANWSACSDNRRRSEVQHGRRHRSRSQRQGHETRGRESGREEKKNSSSLGSRTSERRASFSKREKE
jgi:hypothetical protein